MMSIDAPSPFTPPGPGGRFQFSLATLLLLVALVSVLCSAVAWMGPVIIYSFLLVAGPVGGAIIVRRLKPESGWEVIFWSGVVTVVLWWIVAACFEVACVLANSVEDRDITVGTAIGLAVCVSPLVFGIGVWTSAFWEVVSGVTTQIWKLIVQRNVSQTPQKKE
jgi:hypothetical protein